jgi:hypothetical protein
MSDIQAGTEKPLLVGAYNAHGVRHFLPLSRLELDRATNAARGWLATFQFPVGSSLIVSSSTDVAAQFIPFDQAVVALGLIPCSTDSGAGEASRVESISRRFDPVGIAVPDRQMLAALDVATVLGGKVVWVRPDAYDTVKDVGGIVARRWVEVGPVTAIECTAGQGAHFDRYEWNIEVVDGEFIISSRLPRSLNFSHWHSGVRGGIDHSPCSCGSPDPRITPEAY